MKELVLRPIFATLQTIEKHRINEGVWLDDPETVRRLTNENTLAPGLEKGYVGIEQISRQDDAGVDVQFRISSPENSGAKQENILLNIRITQSAEGAFARGLDFKPEEMQKDPEAGSDNLVGIIITALLVYGAAKNDIPVDSFVPHDSGLPEQKKGDMKSQMKEKLKTKLEQPE